MGWPCFKSTVPYSSTKIPDPGMIPGGHPINTVSESGTPPGSAIPSGTERTERYHAFLSHNGKAKPAVDTLADKLAKRGLTCWLDNWNLIPGDPLQEALELALTQCDTCVVFFVPNGLGPWLKVEMRLALQRRAGSKERKLRVLPVIL